MSARAGTDPQYLAVVPRVWRGAALYLVWATLELHEREECCCVGRLLDPRCEHAFAAKQFEDVYVASGHMEVDEARFLAEPQPTSGVTA